MIVSLFSSGGGGTYNVKLGVALPSVSSNGLVYDGTAKSPTIGSYSSDLMTVTYTPQTNAGTYTVQFSLKDKNKYAWLNTIDSADQYVQWSIAKANGTITASPASVEVGEDETKTVTVTTSQSTTIHATSNNTAVATVSVSGNILSISDGGTEGTATITISADASSNYTYGTKTVAVVVEHLKIVTWAAGTDAQIAKMCAASDQGKLNLWDYWNVGDERTVSLSAMSATGVGESHVANNYSFSIMDKGKKVLQNGKLCAFIIGMRRVLANGNTRETGYMNSSATNAGGWNACARRTWCNSVYYNAISSSIRGIFKQHINKSFIGSTSSTVDESIDYIALFSYTELFGNVTTIDEGQQIEYYKTSSNLIKKYSSTVPSGSTWWLRSPAVGNSRQFDMINASGSYTVNDANGNSGISVFGCIGTANNGYGVTIPSWEHGSDADIVAAIAAADAGEVDLTDYWNIGDKRTVSLSAMAATGVGESHRAQNIVLVLVDKNNANYPYVTATSGRTYCSFVVQQENCLSSTDSGTTSDSERGYINSSNTNTGSWNGCARRTWCNNVYRNAMPSTLRGIFKQVKVTTAKTYNGSTNQQSDDYFFLPAAAEVFKGDSTYGGGGSAGQATAYSNLTEFNALTRWKYYETTGNRVKKMGLSGAAYSWWERSPVYDTATGFCDVGTNGSAYGYGFASDTFGLAPCGCI